MHSGLPAEVRLLRADSPLVFRAPRGDGMLSELTIARADHGVRLRCDPLQLDVDSVEHLLAALAGLSIRSGVVVEVASVELPLLDGGALAFARALTGLAPPRAPPSIHVARTGTVSVGASTYSFEPGESTRLEVEIDFAAPGIGAQRAAWDGTPEAFVRDIAWARTFGFRKDAAGLLAAGRARGADPSTVMVLDDDGHVEPPGAPALPDEFARHKLLDLLGDLYLFGGPPRGVVRAKRPGHAATHRAVVEARCRGIIGASPRPFALGFDAS